MKFLVILLALPFIIAALPIILIVKIIKHVNQKKYQELEAQVLKELGFLSWDICPEIDSYVTVKSRQALENYDETKFFKEDAQNLALAEVTFERKRKVASILKEFIKSNEYTTHPKYKQLSDQIGFVLNFACAYRICVSYISPAGKDLGSRIIVVNERVLNKFKNDPSLLMSKSEYNKYLKEQQKEALSEKQHKYYERVNGIIEYANENRETLVIKGSQDRLDNLIAQLFDRTVNSIKKIKTIDSEEWDIIDEFVNRINNKIIQVVNDNKRILEYYESPDFLKIKDTCDVLMSTQREFNEYIIEKIETVSQLFGTRVVRSETVNDDEYNYIRPYKKTITPFTAEVSSTVFARAENSALEYVIKNCYPNKKCIRSKSNNSLGL